MNAFHRVYCASPEWRRIVEDTILPRALQDVDLGPDVLEIGPGPGFTTDVLRLQVARLTAVEVDAELAAALADRLAGSEVRVLLGDARSLDFPDGSFSGAASFHMLHHIEPRADQDRVLAELARVLRHDGVLVAADGVENDITRAFHADDVYNPIDPGDLPRRLADAGFHSVEVSVYEPGWLCTARA
jgi:SAM-dependent methyltransferase